MNLTVIITFIYFFNCFNCGFCKSLKKKQINQLSQLKYDDNNRLIRNHMLYEKCFLSSEIISWKHYVNQNYTESRGMVKAVADIFRTKNDTSCMAVCLRKGTFRDHVQYPLPHFIYSRGVTDLQQWMDDCEAVELGIITPRGDTVVNLNVVQENGKSKTVLTFNYGTDTHLWSNVPIGAVYEMTDAHSDKLLGRVVVESSGVEVLSPEKFADPETRHSKRENINGTFSKCWQDAQSVRRTFSSRGFEKFRLPMDLWSLLSTYHYNNRDKFVPEERNAIITNPDTYAPSYLLELPPRTVAYVLGRLKELMEDWIGGVELDEHSVLYGIRRYTRGSRLLTHTDHMTTHAVAMIINIDQDASVAAPWTLDIYDFQNRLHEIAMEPGDVLFYEVEYSPPGSQRAPCVLRHLESTYCIHII
jgi:hypothetical protein